MSDICRKDLWNSIGNLKGRNVWINAALKLGLNVTQPSGGSSHYSIRLYGFSNDDINGLVTTVLDGMNRQTNQKVFKRFLARGFKEDDVWRALGLLK